MPARVVRWATTRRAWAGVPLRARLVGILVVALLASLILTGWATQYILRGYLIGQLDTSLRTSARQAGNYAAFYYENGGQTSADVQALCAAAGETYVAP